MLGATALVFAARFLPLAGGGGGGIVPRGTRVNVFREIYWVFIFLGTLVGVVVIAYMLYKAYKYRSGADAPEPDAERPSLGELPQGGGQGRKLFLSLTLSAIIVVSLIAWTYFTLLYVEASPPTEDGVGEDLQVDVTGYQFGWEFEYPNGATSGTLRVPEDTAIQLIVTSRDVFHNFGIPSQRVKTDAIPGQYTDTWFIANETGTYMAQCYELCGVGHSYMTAEVVVMEESEFEQWYQNTSASANTTEGNATNASSLEAIA